MASVLRQKVVKSGDKYAEHSRTSTQPSRVENVQTRVRTIISQIDAQPNAAFGGSLCAGERGSSLPGLSVPPAGNLSLPLSTVQAQQLNMAHLARRGLHRNHIWIPACSIHLRNRDWNVQMQNTLKEKICTRLDIDPAFVEGNPVGMLVVYPSSILASSTDQSSPSVVMQVPGTGSATSAGLVNGFETIYNRQAWMNHSPLATTFASMFVILPSTFVGGELNVREHDPKSGALLSNALDTWADPNAAFQFKTQSFDSHFVVMFKDCTLRMRPISSGHIVILTYHLSIKSDVLSTPKLNSSLAAVSIPRPFRINERHINTLVGELQMWRHSLREGLNQSRPQSKLSTPSFLMVMLSGVYKCAQKSRPTLVGKDLGVITLLRRVSTIVALDIRIGWLCRDETVSDSLSSSTTPRPNVFLSDWCVDSGVGSNKMMSCGIRLSSDAVRQHLIGDIGSDDARIQTEIVNPEVIPITDVVRRRRFPVIVIWPKPAILHVFSFTSMDGALEELARISECIRLSPESTSSRSTAADKESSRDLNSNEKLLVQFAVHVWKRDAASNRKQNVLERILKEIAAVSQTSVVTAFLVGVGVVCASAPELLPTCSGPYFIAALCQVNLNHSALILGDWMRSAIQQGFKSVCYDLIDSVCFRSNPSMIKLSRVLLFQLFMFLETSNRVLISHDVVRILTIASHLNDEAFSTATQTLFRKEEHFPKMRCVIPGVIEFCRNFKGNVVPSPLLQLVELCIRFAQPLLDHLLALLKSSFSAHIRHCSCWSCTQIREIFRKMRKNPMWCASESFSAESSADKTGLIEKCSQFREGFFQAIQLKDTIQQWMHFLLKFSSGPTMPSNTVVDAVDAALSSDSDIETFAAPISAAGTPAEPAEPAERPILSSAPFEVIDSASESHWLPMEQSSDDETVSMEGVEPGILSKRRRVAPRPRQNITQ